ncbi:MULTISPECIES: OmpA family protein [Rhodobacterales]|uniref:OmpA family protein n=1 Tax=Roseobacter sp. N2S TaxID=2663844 RepID=UPI002856D2A1|nr:MULTISPECIES: OmpA family protein [Rhodobacterales]MDR6263034.1 outer membrane protein OmpA-like peptidoglycan-associated protein [Roseobacter sp. N2S]
MRFFSLFCAAIIIAAVLHCPLPVLARGDAAMQVCADILAQYGIAPEGCDPEVDSRREAVEEPVQETSTSPSRLPPLDQQVLDENNIFFQKGGDSLDTEALRKLDLLGRVLNTHLLSTACIRLVGHSDASGPAALNREMGYKRAQAVAQYLRPRLTESARISEVMSDGEDSLLPSVQPENAINRRVTIYARRCQQP